MSRRFKQCIKVTVSILVVSYMVCGCNRVPDNATDLLSQVYKNMAEVSCYSMNSKLVMDTSMSGSSSTITIDTQMSMTPDPFELTIVNTSQYGKEEPTTTYMYTRQKEELENYCYVENEWKKTKIEQSQIDSLKEEYSEPIDFGLYFNEVDSFTITSSNDEAIVIEGTVSGSNMVRVLKETGALKQLSLTSFPEERLSTARPIKVKAWVNPDTICMEKVSIDMTGTYQDLTNLLFDDDSLVSPQINQCVMELSNIIINDTNTILMPEEIQTALNNLL